jgi:hypothetical protein
MTTDQKFCEWRCVEPKIADDVANSLTREVLIHLFLDTFWKVPTEEYARITKLIDSL